MSALFVLGDLGAQLSDAQYDSIIDSAQLVDICRSEKEAVEQQQQQHADKSIYSRFMKKMLYDRQLNVGADVIQYFLVRMERSFLSARLIVTEIDRLTLEEKREVTIPVAKAVLNNVNNELGNYK